jgi:hypothetical protein
MPDCGDVLTEGATKVLASDCASACVGDPSDNCGGADGLNLTSMFIELVHPNVAKLLELFKTRALGTSMDASGKHIHFALCFGSANLCDVCVRFADSDSNNARTLLTAQGILSNGPNSNTAENCVAACGRLDYAYAGVGGTGCCTCFT